MDFLEIVRVGNQLNTESYVAGIEAARNSGWYPVVNRNWGEVHSFVCEMGSADVGQVADQDRENMEVEVGLLNLNEQQLRNLARLLRPSVDVRIQQARRARTAQKTVGYLTTAQQIVKLYYDQPAIRQNAEQMVEGRHSYHENVAQWMRWDRARLSYLYWHATGDELFATTALTEFTILVSDLEKTPPRPVSLYPVSKMHLIYTQFELDQQIRNRGGNSAYLQEDPTAVFREHTRNRLPEEQGGALASWYASFALRQLHSKPEFWKAVDYMVRPRTGMGMNPVVAIAKAYKSYLGDVLQDRKREEWTRLNA